MRHQTALTLIILLSTLPAAPARAEETNPGRSISTSGMATVYVRPDEAVVGLGIESFDPSLDKAKSANDAAARSLLQAIKGLGVEERHVQTDTVQVELRYADGSHPVRGIEGYYARRAVSVTLKDVKLLERLIDAALKNGANQLRGFEYRTSELRKFRDQARQMAAKACREKAEVLAGDLGCRVTDPRTIREDASFGGYWGGNRANIMNNAAQNGAQVVGAAGEGDDTIPLGQIAIQAQVSVTFDLVPDQTSRPATRPESGNTGSSH